MLRRISSQRKRLRPSHAPSSIASAAAISSSVAASVFFPADRSRLSASTKTAPSPTPLSRRASQNSSTAEASPPPITALQSASHPVSVTAGNDSSHGPVAKPSGLVR